MKRVLPLTILLLLAPALLLGDAGVLLPLNQRQPNPAILSLQEMSIDVRIDNGDAHVSIRQIFANHTGHIEEGNYIFALPSHATVSDFAVWDGPTRIPAVILERKRAQEIYSDLRLQHIDPGLLQQGERGAEEARRSAIFSARITPIPAYGTKRLEIEYHESLPVETLKSFFAIPLHPDAYNAQVAGRLTIHFELHSAHLLSDFAVTSNSFPLKIEEKTPHIVRGSLEAANVRFDEDFAVSYTLDGSHADTLEVLTFRNPRPGAPSPAEAAAPQNPAPEPGFFQASALLGLGKSGPGPSAPARTVLALFDNSLSMQWDKLDRSYQALESLLRALRPEDRFNLLLFNTEVAAFSPGPVAATPDQVQKALDFIRASRLRGGTNLQQALDEALKQASTAGGNAYLVLLSDGGATRGVVANGRLAAWYDARWKELPPAQRPRTYVFAVGDDANMPLLNLLSRERGIIENVRSTEPIDFKLSAFLSKIGRSPVEQLTFAVDPAADFDLVYPLQDAVFAGSIASWIGEYRRPQAKASFRVQGMRDGTPLDLRAAAALPEDSRDHPQLPRLWARARVDALLEKIEREGEDQATIDEIIRLARKYKFVTPYTSFLAVPRALLRPRVIRPGDPVIRVKTDPSIVSVVALFPFGLIKKLRYLRDEDIWQTRFLAPTDMEDGTYSVRLMLRDRLGRTYRESKTFIIASKPPLVRIRLDRTRYHRGELMQIRASASASTRTVIARLEGAAPVSLRWNAKAGFNTGELPVPDNLPAGQYRLTVIAEDVAHNIGSQEVSVEILP